MSKTETRTTFQMKFSQAEADRFFEAIGWSTADKPISPPTIATMFRNGEFLLLQDLGIALKNVLHGEQKYKLNKDLRPDITYNCETFIANHHQKSGSNGFVMDFYVFQTNLSEPNAVEPSVECHSTIIARKKAP